MSLRAALGVTGARFDAEGILESLSKYGITVDVVDDNDPELPRGVEACWIPDTVTLTIKESVYKAACRREPRALFTIAHELGHLTLAHRRVFSRDASGTCRVFEDSEWQANNFAAEFLMPIEEIKRANAMSPAQIEATFGVSAQAAETRFNKLRSKGEL